MDEIDRYDYNTLVGDFKALIAQCPSYAPACWLPLFSSLLRLVPAGRVRTITSDGISTPCLSATAAEMATKRPHSSRGGGSEADVDLSKVYKCRLECLKQFVHALQHGTKYIFQTLPRLLTLYFESGEDAELLAMASKLRRKSGIE